MILKDNYLLTCMLKEINLLTPVKCVLLKCGSNNFQPDILYNHLPIEWERNWTFRKKFPFFMKTELCT